MKLLHLSFCLQFIKTTLRGILFLTKFQDNLAILLKIYHSHLIIFYFIIHQFLPLIIIIMQIFIKSFDIAFLLLFLILKSTDLVLTL
jgi:hypothetical protein